MHCPTCHLGHIYKQALITVFLFVLSLGKAESGCASPPVTEPAVRSFASPEGDQQVSGVQVSTKCLIKLQLFTLN